MIKKYVMVALALLVFLMFVSTSSASSLFSKGQIYERLLEKSVFKKIFDRYYQVTSNNADSISKDADDNGGKDGLLSETIDIVGEKTPYEGNYIDVNNSDDTSTIDGDNENGTTQNTVTVDGDVVVNNNMTVEKDGKERRRIILERIVDVVIEHNGKLGAILERVIERTYAPGTTASDGPAENIVSNVVVVGSGGTDAENNKADVVVITDG